MVCHHPVVVRPSQLILRLPRDDVAFSLQCRPEMVLEPPRVRAFSVGSRVSLKLLGGLSSGNKSCNGGGGASPGGGTSSTASSTCSTPISGAARFLAGLNHFKGTNDSSNYIGGSNSCNNNSHNNSPYYMVNLRNGVGGPRTISPSSSCSSSSSFSPYPEFCSPATAPHGTKGRTSKSKSTR